MDSAYGSNRLQSMPQFCSSQYFSVAWTAKVDQSSMLVQLSAYSPIFLIKRAIQKEPIKVPDLERRTGVVLHLSFDDFEEYSAGSASGTVTVQKQQQTLDANSQEKFVARVNSLYASVIDVVLKNSGDIFSMNGNDITAVWIHDISGKSLQIMVERACFCSIKIRELLSDSKFKIPYNISIAAGELTIHYLGGLRDRRAFMLAGKAWSQACTIATPDKIVMTQDARNIAKTNCTTNRLKKDVYELESVQLSVNPSETIQADLLQKIPEDDKARIEASLRSFLASPVLFRLDANQTGWGTELRTVTIVCVQIRDVKNTGMGGVKVQVAYNVLQSVTNMYEGTITGRLMTDNFSLFTLVFGLPPMAHPNDTERGLQAAHTLFERFGSMNMDTSIGLATGVMFCGTLGNQIRREYSVIGRSFRIAVEYSSFQDPGIYCDLNTKVGARAKFLFVEVDGRAGVFKISGTNNTEHVDPNRTAMIGRKLEWGKLWRTLQEYIDKDISRVVVIKGDSGMGKTRMLEEIVQIMGTASPNLILQGAGDPLNNMTPYFAYRRIIHKLLGLEESDDISTKQDIFKKCFQDVNLFQAEDFLPLINTVIPMDIPENAITSKMSGEVRLENVKSLIITLFKICARDSPKLLIIDDAHQMDSLSWSLTSKLRHQIRSFYIVLVMPSNANIPEDCNHLLMGEKTVTLNLKEIPQRDIISIVCSRLKLKEKKLPEKIEKFISEKTQGNPALAIELGLNLHTSGVIQIVDGCCVHNKAFEDLTKFNVPDGIKSYIISRIDAFPASVQLTLKVASVSGKSFPFELLKDVYPTTINEEQLKSDLQQLQLLGVLNMQTFPEYSFKNTVYQEAAYTLMILAQKKILHKNIAMWYERNFSQDLSSYYTILAHHWELSENIQKCVKYLDAAGDLAIQNNANQEVIRFYEKASEFDSRANEEMKAHRFLCIGEAIYNLGRLDDSESAIMSALDSLGINLPSSPRYMKYYVSFYMTRQQLGMCRPSYPAQPHLAENHNKLIIKALLLMSKIRIYKKDMTLSLYTTIRALDLSKQLHDDGDILRSNAALLHCCCNSDQLRGRHHISTELSSLLHDITEGFDSHTQALALKTLSLYHMCSGSLSEVLLHLEKAIFLFGRMGDRRHVQECLYMLANFHYMTGKAALAAKIASDLSEDAEKHAESQAVCWGLICQARYLLSTGNIPQATEKLSSAEKVLLSSDLESTLEILGMQAIASLRQGKVIEAQERALKAAIIINETGTPSFSIYYPLCNITETYMHIWNSTTNHSTLKSQQRRRATDMVEALEKYAAIYPIGMPPALFFRGLLCTKIGDIRAGLGHFREGADLAHKAGLVAEESLFYCELARRDLRKSSRKVHIGKAVALVEETGMTYYLEEALKLQALIDISDTSANENDACMMNPVPVVHEYPEPPVKQTGW